MNKQERRTESPRVFLYRGTLPAGLALLVAAPLLVVALSFVTMLLAGGALTALLLPLALRRRAPRRTDDNCITLERDQYSRVESDTPQLPPR